MHSVVEQKKEHIKSFKDYLGKTEAFGACCSMSLGFMDYCISANLKEQRITGDSLLRIHSYSVKQEQRIHDWFISGNAS